MSRPRKGAAAKSVVISVRLTPAQAAQLAHRYGDPKKAVRAAVEAMLAKDPR